MKIDSLFHDLKNTVLGLGNTTSSEFFDLFNELKKEYPNFTKDSVFDLRKIKNDLLNKKSDVELKIKNYQDLIPELEEFHKWLEGPFIIQSAQSSVFHKVYENPAPPYLFPDIFDDKIVDEILNSSKLKFQVILIQHDWSSLIKDNSQIDVGECRLPHDDLCFEIRVDNRRICAVVLSEDGEPKSLVAFVELKIGWFCFMRCPIKQNGLMGKLEIKFFNLIYDQIFAISIMLDSAVIKHNIVRAPCKLNEKRIKNDKIPLFDHHILSLSRRSRIQNLSVPNEDRDIIKKRLHFRRGHWRHYETTKTWIKWCLVGDQYLGFCDKKYRI